MGGDGNAGSQSDSLDEFPRLTRLLKLFTLIVLCNFVLYLLIVYFAVVLFSRSVPDFIAFLQFLAFIFPLTLLLRLGLKENPAVGQIDNPYLKAMGATPTLVIVSCFVALLATFATTLGGQMFPKPEGVTSIATRVGVKCNVQDNLSAPSTAAFLLTLVSADSPAYIDAVRRDLLAHAANGLAASGRGANSKPIVYQFAEAALMNVLKSLDLVGETPQSDDAYKNVTLVKDTDPLYNLLYKLIATDADVQQALAHDELRIAFIVPVGKPSIYTRLPVRMQVGMRNHTSVFLLTLPKDRAAKNISGDPFDASAAVTRPSQIEPEYDIRKISQVEVLPRSSSDAQGTEWNLNVLASSCWNTASELPTLASLSPK